MASDADGIVILAQTPEFAAANTHAGLWCATWDHDPDNRTAVFWATGLLDAHTRAMRIFEGAEDDEIGLDVFSNRRDRVDFYLDAPRVAVFDEQYKVVPRG